MYAVRDPKTEAVASILIRTSPGKINKLLVVGCGTGLEPAILNRELRASVTGVDLQADFDKKATDYVELKRGDAMSLEFEDETFDFIYSYHSLEHMANPSKALNEMNRVLRHGGSYWIGTPNRSRLIANLGARDIYGKRATWPRIWRANVRMWSQRLRGKFRNEFGAHAGFSSKELDQLLKDHFPEAEPRQMSYPYYLELYDKYSVFVKALRSLGMGPFMFPSIYFFGTKKLH